MDGAGTMDASFIGNKFVHVPSSSVNVRAFIASPQARHQLENVTTREKRGKCLTFDPSCAFSPKAKRNTTKNFTDFALYARRLKRTKKFNNKKLIKNSISRFPKRKERKNQVNFHPKRFSNKCCISKIPNATEPKCSL